MPRSLGEHRLRREIIVTATTNSIVNRMGPPSWPHPAGHRGGRGYRGPGLLDRARGVRRPRDLGIDRAARQPSRGDGAVRDGPRYRGADPASDVLAHPASPRRSSASRCRWSVCVPASANLRHRSRMAARARTGSLRSRAAELPAAGVPAPLARQIAACNPLASAHRTSSSWPARISLSVASGGPHLLRHVGTAFGLDWLRCPRRGTRHPGTLARRRPQQPARGALRRASRPHAARARARPASATRRARWRRGREACGRGGARAWHRRRHPRPAVRRRLRLALRRAPGRAPARRRREVTRCCLVVTTYERPDALARVLASRRAAGPARRTRSSSRTTGRGPPLRESSRATRRRRASPCGTCGSLTKAFAPGASAMRPIAPRTATTCPARRRHGARTAASSPTTGARPSPATTARACGFPSTTALRDD